MRSEQLMDLFEACVITGAHNITTDLVHSHTTTYISKGNYDPSPPQILALNWDQSFTHRLVVHSFVARTRKDYYY
jgi:hypothetical protein